MYIVLHRKTKAGKTYYYSLDDRQRTLFAACALSLRWGHSVTGGSTKELFFSSISEKDAKAKSILQEKRKTYEVLYSYLGDAHEPKAQTPKAAGSE
jgi:hypothetical protein